MDNPATSWQTSLHIEPSSKGSLTMPPVRQAQIEKLMAHVVQRYGSLREPNFGFVMEELARQPSLELCRSLMQFVQLQDMTTPDEDVSFRYFIADDGPEALASPPRLSVPRWSSATAKKRWGWELRLSMIGPYAVLMNEAVITGDQEHYHSETEKRIVDSVTKVGLELLDAEILEYPVPLRLFNTAAEDVRMYQALFVDWDILPWRWHEDRGSSNAPGTAQ